MKTIRIYCKRCTIKLTDNLIEVEEKNVREEYNVDAISKNSFAVINFNETKQLIVALDDYYLVNHPDTNRFHGCCGSSTFEFNKLCKNGHEVAKEISDCWLPHYIEFDLDKIIIKEIISDYEFKIITF